VSHSQRWQGPVEDSTNPKTPSLRKVPGRERMTVRICRSPTSILMVRSSRAWVARDYQYSSVGSASSWATFPAKIRNNRPPEPSIPLKGYGYRRFPRHVELMHECSSFLAAASTTRVLRYASDLVAFPAFLALATTRQLSRRAMKFIHSTSKVHTSLFTVMVSAEILFVPCTDD